MKQFRGKIDELDLAFVKKTHKQILKMAEPCPLNVIKQGKNAGLLKINPQTTRFYCGNGEMIDVVHVKPIYYLHQNQQWRPMDEIASGFGNSWIHLKSDWDTKIDLRYLRWLMRRMEFVKAKIGVCIPLEESILVNKDRELVLLREAKNIYFTISTFYPDANPESTSVDGDVGNLDVSGADWEVLRGSATGDFISDTSIYLDLTLRCDGNTNKWDYIQRTIVLFDVSSIDAGDIVSIGTFSLYGHTVNDDFTSGVSLVSSSPASNTELVPGDYNSLGTTKYASDIASSSWTISDYNHFTLNSAGKTFVQTALDGDDIVKFGVLIDHDLGNNEPTWNSTHEVRIQNRSADQANTTVDPKLVLTHAPVVVGGTIMTTNKGYW